MSLQYNVIVATYTRQREMEVSAGCNGFTARNIGDDVVTVNGVALQPRPGAGLSGESFSFGGNVGEIFAGRIQIRFAGVGVAPQVEITQKFYLQDQRY